MLKKRITALFLLIILSLLVNIFHHDIANIWHAGAHIINLENYQHTHHSFDSSTNLDGDKTEENHHHKLITEFVSSFDIEKGSAQDGDLTDLFAKDFKHIRLINTKSAYYNSCKTIKLSKLSPSQKLIYLPRIAAPPQS